MDLSVEAGGVEGRRFDAFRHPIPPNPHPAGREGGTLDRPPHLRGHPISTTADLPEGSTCLASREFDEYRIELYVRRDQLRHAVVRPKMFLVDGRPNLRGLFTRMPAFSREVLGNKMYHSYSVEG